MRISWKRYHLGAILLASLSLLLSGCSDFGGAPTTAQITPATKSISGVVSDSETGLPVLGARVTAYAIDGAGVQAATPLSVSPESVLSGVDGSYTLKIPKDYSASVMLEASIPSAKLIDRIAKAVNLSAGTKIRSVIPASVVSSALAQNPAAAAGIPPVMISFATEAVVQFIEQNIKLSSAPVGFSATGFSLDNIQKASFVMETFFGPNFAETPPPKSELDLRNSSKAQQDLMVVIRALNLVAAESQIPISQIVTSMATTGLGETANTILDAINEVVSLNLAGIIPPAYAPSSAIVSAITDSSAGPVTPPDLSDTTAPTAPGALAAAAVDARKVGLTWSPATDATGVAGYTIYRAEAAGSFLAIETVGGERSAYQDLTVAASTHYSYKVVAFDAARNLSEASAVATVDTPAGTPADTAPAPTTYFITGRVTLNGAGLMGVIMNTTGSGTGSVSTDASGNYAIPVLNGSYQITPALTGYEFTPASLPVTVNGANTAGRDFSSNGSATGGVTYPGSVTGGVTYPNGYTTGVVSYPSGTVIGGVTYPPGTIIGGVSYPSGTVIGGVNYPSATVIGGVTYPTGTVIGGVTYPGGVVIGGVSYPPGTVVGGVAFPVGAVTTGFGYPSGTVIGGVTYPTGTVTGGLIYPGGTIIGSVTYPSATVIGGVSYPSGSVTGNVTYPSGTVIGGTSYPAGTIIGGVTYPSASVIGGVSYPSATVIGGVVYPTGTVIGGVSYPNGVVIGGVSYPPGTVVGGVAFPAGVVTTGFSYPSATVIGGVAYPSGTATGAALYPGGSLAGSVTYPSGTVIGGVTYPSGSITGSLLF